MFRSDELPQSEQDGADGTIRLFWRDASHPNREAASGALFSEDQFHRTVIRPHDLIVDDDVLNSWHKRLRDEEKVQPPANTPGAGVEAVRPPGVLDPVRVEPPVGIDKTGIEKILNPLAVLRHEPRGLFIGFWILQIDGHVGGIEIACDHDGFPFRVKRIA